MKKLKDAMKSLNEVVGMPNAEELEALFDERTKKHVWYVQHYARVLANMFPELAGLKVAAAQHDASKWSAEEKPGYILTTWSYKTTGKGSKDPLMKAAWEHHQKTNDHHPEFWDPIMSMPALAMGHMVADWAAMSAELGNSLMDWVSKATDRWAFTPEQMHTIRRYAQATTEVDDLGTVGTRYGMGWVKKGAI